MLYTVYRILFDRGNCIRIFCALFLVIEHPLRLHAQTPGILIYLHARTPLLILAGMAAMSAAPAAVVGKIPLVDLKANYASIRADVDAKIKEVLDSCYFVGSPHVSDFEKDFADYCGVAHAIGVNSGTDALILALKFLGVGPGDEVITQGNTFIATCLGASSNGATIVLCDVDEETYMMDTSKLESLITEKTKAIVPVHLYGRCADMDSILDIAKRYDLIVVEDAAQAHGAIYKGARRAGSMGHAGCFSFYPGKNLGAFGDGGMIVTKSSTLAQKIKEWRSWGAKKKYVHDVKGGNSRLDSIQAAVLGVKLQHLDAWNASRRCAARMYTSKLSSVDGLVAKDSNKIIQLPICDNGDNEGLHHVWHLYVIQCARRDELLKHLNDNGVGASIHYPVPIHELGAYKEEARQYAAGLVNCTLAAPRLLSLPLFPEISEEQIDRVVSLVANFYNDAE